MIFVATNLGDINKTYLERTSILKVIFKQPILFAVIR